LDSFEFGDDKCLAWSGVGSHFVLFYIRPMKPVNSRNDLHHKHCPESYYYYYYFYYYYYHHHYFFSASTTILHLASSEQ